MLIYIWFTSYLSEDEEETVKVKTFEADNEKPIEEAEVSWMPYKAILEVHMNRGDLQGNSSYQIQRRTNLM